MALLDQLLSFAIPGAFGLGSAAIQANAIDKASQRQTGVAQQAIDLAKAPVFSPFGDVQEFGKAPQLTPETQALANLLRSGQTSAAQAGPEFGDLTQELIKQFRGIDRTGIADKNAADFTTDRNFVTNSILNPAVSDAQKLDARLNRGSTNPNRSLEAVTRASAPTLATIGKVAESDKGTARLDEAIRQSLGLAQGTSSASTAASTQVPQPFSPLNAGQQSNAANAVSGAANQLPGPNLALAQGLSGFGTSVQAAGQAAQATADRNRLFELFERTIGNQGKIATAGA